MRRSDRTVLAALAAAAILGAFWLLVLSPKRDDAAKLGDQVDQLRASVQQEQQLAADARAAKRDFARNYHHLVVLGKGVPADADTPSLLVQLQKLADRSGVNFRAITLEASGDSGASQVATPAPLTSPSNPSGSPSGSGASSSSGSAATPASAPASTPAGAAPATEAAASLLPLGAGIGPAGLPVMPYEVKVRGGFFDVADFLSRLDGLVHLRHGRVVVDGRLLTVDGFHLNLLQTVGSAAAAGPNPTLVADLHLTTYVTPADQGVTAGATPAGPPAVPASAGTSSSTSPTTTPAATATAP